LAEFTNADRLVLGQYLRVGDQIRIDATLRDLKRQQVVVLKAGAPNEKELLGAIDQLARSIQENLTLSSKAVKELRAAAFTPSSKSVPALRYYSEGIELSRQGKHLEARKRFEASSKEDNLFALAYSRLGQTYANLGYDKEAEQISRKAVDLTGKVTAQEKYLILATHARIVNDHQKAIEAYESLARVSPDDPDVQFSLAELYQATGSFDRARQLYAKLLTNDPKYIDAMIGMARVEVTSGNPQGGLDYLNRALSLAIQLENDDERSDDYAWPRSRL
jgi:tetratricopeptide (TPR) repeat protein